MGSAEHGRRPEIPATVIRRIQSFLSPENATQSTLVSKSWRVAWSTRPTLVLDESQFSNTYTYSKKVDPLLEFATNTFRTYEESKVETRIETFRLCLKSDWYARSGLANEWTLKALEMGATDLTFRFAYPSGFYIPIDEIFASQNVVSLSLDKTNIDRLKVIKCSALKYLTLSNMEISTHLFFNIIISFCPLIESLSLSNISTRRDENDKSNVEVTKCSGLKSLTLSIMTLSNDFFFNMISCCPSIENLSLSRISTRRDDENTIIVGLGKLRSLALHDTEFQFQTLILDDMSSKFPNLKELSVRLRLRPSQLEFSRRGEAIRVTISSPSLEILSFIYIEDENRQDTWVRIKCDVSVEFDVPSIRKFTCEGKCIPNYMSFNSISRYQLESHISITHHGELSTKWFSELRRFLEKLTPSKMHVYLHVDNKKSFDYRKREMEGLNVVEVENLTLNTKGLPSWSFQVVLDALFRMCRPKMITHCAINPPDDSDGRYAVHRRQAKMFDHTEKAIHNDVVLCRELIQGMKVKSLLIPSQHMYGLRDLEEVDVQKLSRGVWTSQPLDSILDDDDDSQRRIRLQLKWKQSTGYPYLPRVLFPLLITNNNNADREYSYDALPEAIIHRIQSLLSHRESAQTALLSKSWLAAWSTRPTIYLAQSHFQKYYNHFQKDYKLSAYPKLDPLTVFANNTFRRYEESNLRIDTFRLCLWNDHDLYVCSGLAAKWTLKALQMGAIDLTLRFLDHDYDEYSIPIDQVFRSENLVSLHMHRLKIHRATIKCSLLKSLTLSDLKIPNISFLHAIVSSCPLLQNLSLSRINCSRRNEVKADVRQGTRRSMIRLHKLTSLTLCSVMFKIETFFLDDLSSKFPNLRTLDFAPEKYKDIISSRSIEALYFKITPEYEYNLVNIEETPRAEFDVPSIRMFTYVGSCMTELSFTSTSCDQFESRVSVEHFGHLSTKWFSDLSEFLSQLRGSKIHLCLRVCCRESFHYQLGEIKGLNVCEVEDLTMATRGLPSISFDALLDGLFRMCRPRMITRYLSPPKDDDEDEEKKLPYYRRGKEDPESVYDPGNTVNNDISLCEALEQGVKVRSFSTTQFMYGLRDLEEVNAQQLFDGVWMPQPFDLVLDSLLKYDKSVRSEQIRRFRFQLKWKSR